MVIYTRVAFLPAFPVFSAVFLGVPLALGRVEWNGPVPVWIGIMALTQATEDAVLSPGVAGGLSPALRVVAGLRLLGEIA